MRQELGCIHFDHLLSLKGKQLKQSINMKSFHLSDLCFIIPVGDFECDGVTPPHSETHGP